jgi:hypothetical protein
MGYGATSTPAPKAAPVEEETPWVETPKPVATKQKAPAPVVEEEEDEDLAMFRKLAED